MKNLFDFATKELSQDAFICWLVSNYDNKENEILREAAYEYINFLADTKYTFDDIKHLNVLKQALKLDIIIDIWENERIEDEYKKTYTSDFTIVIEDKADSSAHNNQLLEYYAITKNWNKAKGVRRIFYKSNYLSFQDVKELNRCISSSCINTKNENDSSAWLVKTKDRWEVQDINDINVKYGIYWNVYDINKINSFFEKYSKEKVSEIFDSYVKYICQKYTDIKIINKTPSDWNFNNYNCFILNEIIPLYDKKFPGGIYNWNYLGKYVSTGFYLKTKFKTNDWNNSVCLEIFYRPEKKVFNATIHPEYKYKDGTYSWKIIDKIEYEEENTFNREFRQKLAELVKESKTKFFKIYNSKQCVAKTTNYGDINRFQNYEILVKNFKLLIDEFINIFADKV